MKKVIITICFSFFVVYALYPQKSIDNSKENLNITDANGLKQGYWRKVDNYGKLIYEGKFKNNIPEDTFRYYYPDKKLKAISVYSNQGKNVFTKMYYENTKLMSEGYYVDTKKDSIWKYYDNEGKLISTEHYKNFNKHGKFSTYYNNGNVAEEVIWVNGIRNGVWKQYFEDNKLKLLAGYKENMFDGDYKAYYASGVLYLSGQYKNGFKEGKWVYYKEIGGKVLKNEIYQHGIMIKQEILDDELKKKMKEDEYEK